MSLDLPAPLHVETVMGAIDLEGRRTAATARDHTVGAVRRVLPARTGRARAGTRGRARRSPTGYTVEVFGDSRVRYPNGVSAREVLRWLEGGTGERGPRGRPIPPGKRGRLPSGAVPSGRGQAAQHPFARVQSAEEARVTRIMQAGAEKAAQAAERALEG